MTFLQRVIACIAAATRTLDVWLRFTRRAAMIGTPPSARKARGIPADVAKHARQFAIEYADRLEIYVEGRMHGLDVPDEQIGYSDNVHGVPWRVFFPHDGTGGGVVGPRIGVDSGVLNPELLTKPYGPEAAAIWAKARLRDRIDAIIVHEQQEGLGLTHKQAVERAAATPLSISEGTRRILRAMAEAEYTR